MITKTDKKTMHNPFSELELPQLEPIPSRWQNWHNGVLVLPLFASMLLLLFKLDQSSLAVVEIAGARLEQVAWVTALSLVCGAYAVWLHARKLWSQGIAFRNDGRDDRVLTGIILGTALVFCCLWSAILDYNESAPLELAPQKYRLATISGSSLVLEPFLAKAKGPRLKLNLSGYKHSLFKRMQPGDSFGVKRQPGRLGFEYISLLIWRNKQEKSMILWPRQRPLHSPQPSERRPE
jgi:hypothetical protein